MKKPNKPILGKKSSGLYPKMPLCVLIFYSSQEMGFSEGVMDSSLRLTKLKYLTNASRSPAVAKGASEHMLASVKWSGAQIVALCDCGLFQCFGKTVSVE